MHLNTEDHGKANTIQAQDLLSESLYALQGMRLVVLDQRCVRLKQAFDSRL